MIELPEAYVLSGQIQQTLVGKKIARAEANAHPHGFAAYTGDPAAYDGLLKGRTITGTGHGLGYTCGGNVEIFCGDMMMAISTPIKYHAPGEKDPKKHQLLVTFEDGSRMSCTVQMWGCMYCFPTKRKAEASAKPQSETEQPSVYRADQTDPSPLSDAFDEKFFDELRSAAPANISAKAFLATEQRIPGLGNGVVQDILFNAGVHPKRKMETLNDSDFEKLFNAVRNTLREMAAKGGRDTEKDLFNRPGGYQTILSKKTLYEPCKICGGNLAREAYLGGNIYYCPNCQLL